MPPPTNPNAQKNLEELKVLETPPQNSDAQKNFSELKSSMKNKKAGRRATRKSRGRK